MTANNPSPRPFAGAADKIIAFPGTEPSIEHAKEDLFEVFTIGKLNYRLGGVKPLFVTSLRVSVRVKPEQSSGGDKNYYDTLDLYSARNRAAFAQSAEKGLGAESARIERDLARILECLETERDSRLGQQETRVERRVSEEDKKAGMELLSDSGLFKRIADDLSSLGYVGEDINKQLLYLCASSRKRDNPLNVLFLSRPASGKSYLVDCVRQLMPEDEVITVTSFSDQALNYLNDLEHKFLILGEAVRGASVERQIREMLLGRELSRLVVEKDAESGLMKSRMIKMKAIVSSVTSGAAGKVNPGNASRYFVIHADESKEQTELIHAYQRRRRGFEFLSGDRTVEIIKTHRAAQKLLRNIPVVNDYASFLDFPATQTRNRGDHERFLDLIDTVCFLRQYQKETEYKDGVCFIRCDLQDYETAYNIMTNGTLSGAMEELPRGARLLHERIREWAGSETKKRKLKINELKFTQRQIREATGLGHSWTAAMLRALVEWEYVEQTAGSGQRSKAWYNLRSDDEIIHADLSMIPSPKKLYMFLNA